MLSEGIRRRSQELRKELLFAKMRHAGTDLLEL
jgi:hypothetical protein